MTNTRHQTVGVRVGDICIGGGAPVAVQSMTLTDTADAAATAAQCLELVEAGSELVRVTVNQPKAAQAVPDIKQRLLDGGCTAPLIGDFHYNGHLLLTEYPRCAAALDKYRINPGNVGTGQRRDEQFGTICKVARDHGKPVRIGVNGGSHQLWINRGNGRFVDKGVSFGVAADQNGQLKAGMGVAILDVDDDADEDLLVVNLTGERDSFFLNQGTHFVDRTAALGLAAQSQAYTRFGVGFADFDNDGQADLYQANGRVSHGPESGAEDPFAELNLLYRGAPGGRFTQVLPTGGSSRPLVATSRGAAFGDVDGDGGVDVLVVNRDGPVHLLRNRVADRGHWIRFEARESSGRDALGATLSVRVGERTLTRRVRSAYSYCTASEPVVHLGLGAVREVDDVSVRWVDGRTESFGPRQADRVWRLVRGAGEER